MKEFDTVNAAVKFAEEHHIVSIKVESTGNGKYAITHGEQLPITDDSEARVYNLTLYLHYFQKLHPGIFYHAQETVFDGMPGYDPSILDKEILDADFKWFLKDGE